MSKTIYLCRHAQAEHNVAEDYSIADAPLTALGKSQTAALAKDPRLDAIRREIQLVASSGLKRTLQTTKLGWGAVVERLGGLARVEVLPQLQECNAFPCDTGSPREVLERDPELAGFDLRHLTPDWTSKQGFYAPDAASLAARAKWVRQWLRARPESVIVVIAHGDILRRITQTQYPWSNAEVQQWTFDDAARAGSDEARLQLVRYITAEGAPAPTSSDAAHHGNGGVALPGLSSSGSFDLTKEFESVAAQNVGELEQRVKEKQTVVASRTTELQELEERLQAAERRKAELEAKGVKI